MSAIRVLPDTVVVMNVSSSTRRDRATFSARAFDGYENSTRHAMRTAPPWAVGLRGSRAIPGTRSHPLQPTGRPPRAPLRGDRCPRHGSVRKPPDRLLRDSRARSLLPSPLARHLRLGRRADVERRGKTGGRIAPARFELASQAPKARRLDRYPTGLARTNGGRPLKDSRKDRAHFTWPIPDMSSSPGGANAVGTFGCPTSSSAMVASATTDSRGIALITGTRRESLPRASNRRKSCQYANAPKSGRIVIFVARNVRKTIWPGPPVVSYGAHPNTNDAIPKVTARLSTAKSNHEEGFIGRGENTFDGRRRTKSRRATAAARSAIVATIHSVIMSSNTGGVLEGPPTAKSARV